jgi:hypothetical protein
VHVGLHGEFGRPVPEPRFAMAADVRLLAQDDNRSLGESGLGGLRSGCQTWFLVPVVPGRVAPGHCSPRAPADPYVPSRAYGSSYHELATGRLPE